MLLSLHKYRAKTLEVMSIDKHISDEKAQFVILLLMGFYLAILTPIIVYYSLLLTHLNACNVLFISKRHVKLVLISVLSWNTYGAIIRPILDISRIRNTSGTYSITEMVLYNSFQLPAAFICCRLWLIYYDYTHELKTLDHQWQKTITHATINDWTSRYKWLGNSKIILSFFLILTLTMDTTNNILLDCSYLVNDYKYQKV